MKLYIMPDTYPGHQVKRLKRLPRAAFFAVRPSPSPPYGRDPEKEVTLLQFDHVNLSYGGQKIIHDISFEIQDGQFAVFIGPSGCGKTTTLKMINRLIKEILLP